jgi:hypothetical protein
MKMPLCRLRVHTALKSPEGNSPVSDRRTPAHHSDPWVDLTHGYVRTTAREVAAHRDLTVQDCWLDPMGPRDATVLYRPRGAGLMALVWDEDGGWRAGRFVTGRPGRRTVLADDRHLGGGVLPGPTEVLARLRAGVRAPALALRSHTALRDGLDERLAHWAY